MHGHIISLKLLIDKRIQWNTKRDSIPHLIMGYSMYKIEAAAHFFAFAAWLLHLSHGFYFCHAAFAFAARLLHLPCGFYIYCAAFAFAVRLLHLPCGFYICCAAFAFATRLLHLPCGFYTLPCGF